MSTNLLIITDIEGCKNILKYKAYRKYLDFATRIGSPGPINPTEFNASQYTLCSTITDEDVLSEIASDLNIDRSTITPYNYEKWNHSYILLRTDSLDNYRYYGLNCEYLLIHVPIYDKRYRLVMYEHRIIPWDGGLYLSDRQLIQLDDEIKKREC